MFSVRYTGSSARRKNNKSYFVWKRVKGDAGVFQKKARALITYGSLDIADQYYIASQCQSYGYTRARTRWLICRQEKNVCIDRHFWWPSILRGRALRSRNLDIRHDVAESQKVVVSERLLRYTACRVTAPCLMPGWKDKSYVKEPSAYDSERP